MVDSETIETKISDKKEEFDENIEDEKIDVEEEKTKFDEKFDETKEKAQHILEGDTRNYLDMIESMQQGTAGIEYRYEYKVVPVLDDHDRVDAERLAGVLNNLGQQGWTLKSALTNDVSKGAGALLGLRTATEETVLIFERRIRI